jgi:hypothetical protein
MTTKKTTMALQPDRAETSNPGLLNNHPANPKMYRDHKICDHYIHGRVNKFPFGSSNGPLFF